MKCPLLRVCVSALYALAGTALLLSASVSTQADPATTFNYNTYLSFDWPGTVIVSPKYITGQGWAASPILTMSATGVIEGNLSLFEDSSLSLQGGTVKQWLEMFDSSSAEISGQSSIGGLIMFGNSWLRSAGDQYWSVNGNIDQWGSSSSVFNRVLVYGSVYCNNDSVVTFADSSTVYGDVHTQDTSKLWISGAEEFGHLYADGASQVWLEDSGCEFGVRCGGNAAHMEIFGNSYVGGEVEASSTQFMTLYSGYYAGPIVADQGAFVEIYGGQYHGEIESQDTSEIVLHGNLRRDSDGHVRGTLSNGDAIDVPVSSNSWYGIYLTN